MVNRGEAVLESLNRLHRHDGDLGAGALDQFLDFVAAEFHVEGNGDSAGHRDAKHSSHPWHAVFADDDGPVALLEPQRNEAGGDVLRLAVGCIAGRVLPAAPNLLAIDDAISDPGMRIREHGGDRKGRLAGADQLFAWVDGVSRFEQIADHAGS